MAPELLIQISGHWSISRLPTAIVEDKEMKFHVIVYIQISEVRLDKASRRERINNMVRRSRLSTTACIDSIFDRHNQPIVTLCSVHRVARQDVQATAFRIRRENWSSITIKAPGQRKTKKDQRIRESWLYNPISSPNNPQNHNSRQNRSTGRIGGCDF